MSDNSLFGIARFPSREVTIGDRPLGGNNPIRLQSMTNTNTLDVKATLEQCIRILLAGADYVRISAPNMETAHALKEIKSKLKDAGFYHPVIADIHFKPEVALMAARYVEKIRINPGNYVKVTPNHQTDFTTSDREKEIEQIRQKISPLVNVCKDFGTAIRIGTNMGSLSQRIISQYGNTPEGMVAATMEFIEVFRELDFHNLVISLKASKPLIMVQAYELMVEKMLEENMHYPLHTGITEAGEGENGRIKSALGICTLLNKGIGDTVRVSLTEEPEKEIPFATKITSVFQLPFTRDSNNSFKPGKTLWSEKDIFFPETKLKAIVIESLRKDYGKITNKVVTHQEKPDLNDKNSSIAPVADFLFTENLDITTANPERKFIIPSEKFAKEKYSNAKPLFELNEKNTLPGKTGFKNYFIQIPCSAVTKSFTLPFEYKPFAVIAEPDNTNEPHGLDEIITVCQTEDIPVIVRKKFSTKEADEIIGHIAILFGRYLLGKKIQGLWFEAPNLDEDIVKICFGFLQSAGLRITRTEFISCPTCARTSFDMQNVLHQIQKHTDGFPGLKIAVMGCVVNGPGEMADADFGYVGAANGKLHLYKGREVIAKNIEPINAVRKLEEILRQYGYLD
ncbi:MAG: 4-hydroxy-3-methylbut-2-en-1-yl diphosphate synthase [Bacteroidetes bacterium]|nr:MAG: 4-hydroxy-3-methylbut-2-en-1-yl diphosphate synthase [Bacteroidota bacterium]